MESYFHKLLGIKPLKSIFKSLESFTKISPKSQQDQIDLYRACILLNGHDWYLKRKSLSITTTSFNSNSLTLQEDYTPTQLDVNKILAYVDSMSASEVRGNVQKLLEKQISNILREIHENNSSDENVDENDVVGGRLDKIVDRSKLIDRLGFELECRQSSISDAAGQGVFVKKGKIFPGTVIAFFPGYVHLAEHTSDKVFMETLLPDEHFQMVVRNDGHIIDGRGASKVPNNPFSYGNMINHVPKGKLVNCHQV